MATRYLTALGYSDWHSNNILKKHAKKRPLGDLESRYQYTPAQPVLSCRTVDIDLSGTRTYRPKSTTDIIAEQHKLIHSLFKKSRAATSAPPRRSPRIGLGLVSADNNVGVGKIRIEGRPYTSQSQSSGLVGQQAKSKRQRPKTTGRLQNVKPATDTFMVLQVDDLLESRRSQNELTNQIHAHWRPENANLNQGKFMRGQKRPDDVPPTLDAWLTFGGAAGESGGVVDAFANYQNAHDYYNIEGSVGSRVAQQLQKGDRIRIGINGEVLSHDLKVKKWVKGDASEVASHDDKEAEEEEVGHESVGKGDSPKEAAAVATPDSARTKKSQEDAAEDMFGEMMFETLDDMVELEDTGLNLPSSGGRKKEKKVKAPEFPLNWDDQLTRPEVKVIKARETPRDDRREGLSETHPVLFEKRTKTNAPLPKLASTTPSNGYRIKHRPLGNSRSDHRHETSGSKVKAITFDHNTPEDERRLSSMSVDDVIQSRLQKSPCSLPQKSKSQARNGGGDAPVTSHLDDVNLKSSVESHSEAEKPRSQSSMSGKGSVPSKISRPREASSAKTGSTRLLGRSGSSVPSVSRDLDLSIMTPNHRSRRSASNSGGLRGSQNKGLAVTKAMPIHRGLGGGVSSINAGPIPGDTEFIQIAQPIRNPNSSLASASSGARSLYSPYTPTPGNGNSPPRSNTPMNGLHNSPETSPVGTPAPQPSELSEPDGDSTKQSSDMLNINSTPSYVSHPSKESREPSQYIPPTSGPTSELGGSKAISIPTGSRLDEDEEEELTVAQRRERSFRDQQIDQITHLLGEAILGETPR